MRSRLAPSPTGALHLGNARTFLLNRILVRNAGGCLLLRMEDLDGPRVKPGAAAKAWADLRWLGIEGDGEVLVQSTRSGAHAAALERLREAGLVYPCACTRREIERAASAPQEGDDATPYPGTCRDRFPDGDAAREATGREPAWRFRVHRDREVEFEDRVHGTVRFRPSATRGDFVVARRGGAAAYQLAVVVDDAFQGVDEVVRGDDLLDSTPLQVLLHEALDLEVPRYTHLPLVRGEDGRRLAKRHGDTRIAAYREAGVAPERVVGLLAEWSGFGPREPVAPGDLESRGWALDRLPRADPVFTEADNAWLRAP